MKIVGRIDDSFIKGMFVVFARPFLYKITLDYNSHNCDYLEKWVDRVLFSIRIKRIVQGYQPPSSYYEVYFYSKSDLLEFKLSS